MIFIAELLLAKPDWLKIRLPTDKYPHVKGIEQKYGIATICTEGKCPNLSECWSSGTATFMIMGDTCTRGCRFCNVKTSRMPRPLDKDEPRKLVQAIKEMKTFDYIVLTSVDRDELLDQGSSHFAECISLLKKEIPGLLVEVLIPDFTGNKKLIDQIIESGPDVIAHNIETVESLQRKVRDPRANYSQSLSVLEYVKAKKPSIITKSSIMLGFGEKEEEVIQTMKDLLKVGVEIFTLGQYLRPSIKHTQIIEYVHPIKFNHYKEIGESLGFRFVASGPMVRSSYKAGELFIKHILNNNMGS